VEVVDRRARATTALPGWCGLHRRRGRGAGPMVSRRGWTTARCSAVVCGMRIVGRSSRLDRAGSALSAVRHALSGSASEKEGLYPGFPDASAARLRPESRVSRPARTLFWQRRRARAEADPTSSSTLCKNVNQITD